MRLVARRWCTTDKNKQKLPFPDPNLTILKVIKDKLKTKHNKLCWLIIAVHFKEETKFWTSRRKKILQLPRGVVVNSQQSIHWKPCNKSDICRESMQCTIYLLWQNPDHKSKDLFWGAFFLASFCGSRYSFSCSWKTGVRLITHIFCVLVDTFPVAKQS